MTCLPSGRSDDMIIVDDNTVFYRAGSQLYRKDFQGGSCNGLGTGHYALVTRQFSGSLCRGDIAQVVDTGSGVRRQLRARRLRALFADPLSRARRLLLVERVEPVAVRLLEDVAADLHRRRQLLIVDA